MTPFRGALGVLCAAAALSACGGAERPPTVRYAASRAPMRDGPMPLAHNPIARLEIIQGMRRDPLRYCARRFIAPRRIERGRRRLLIGVRGKSMTPTLRSGDLIITIAPDRPVSPGDMVVFVRQDGSRRLIVKRVVAREGDRVAVAAGHLVINGRDAPTAGPIAWRTGDMARMCRRDRGAGIAVLQQRLPNGRSFPIVQCGGRITAPRDVEALRVPYQHVYAMGDNRDRSVDSRIFGPIPASDIIGVVACTARLPGDGDVSRRR